MGKAIINIINLRKQTIIQATIIRQQQASIRVDIDVIATRCHTKEAYPV